MTIKSDQPRESIMEDDKFGMRLTLKQPVSTRGTHDRVTWRREMHVGRNKTPAKKRTVMWQSGLAEAVMNNILQISVHPKKMLESFEDFLKFTKIDTAPRRARLLPKGFCDTSASQARRNYLWNVSVAKFVKVIPDFENRDLIDRFHFRGTEHYDARALGYDEIANTMAALSEHYKGLLGDARAQASDEYENNGPPTDAEEQTARHLFHAAMIADGEIERSASSWKLTFRPQRQMLSCKRPWLCTGLLMDGTRFSFITLTRFGHLEVNDKRRYRARTSRTP